MTRFDPLDRLRSRIEPQIPIIETGMDNALSPVKFAQSQLNPNAVTFQTFAAIWEPTPRLRQQR
jgi:hypothetical protein